jgi:MFS family permease
VGLGLGSERRICTSAQFCAGAGPTLIDRLLGGRLWRDLDLVLLWTGQTVSEVGSQVTFLALPLTAILLLHASPFQVGLLGALLFLSFLPTLGLVAGVYVDRVKRRWIMIICDLGRMLALGSIPAAYAMGWTAWRSSPVSSPSSSRSPTRAICLR